MPAPTGENPPIQDWRAFLDRWSREWLQTGTRFSRKVRDEQWLGYGPATERQISLAEKRVGLVLPPSYKAFLRASNGWRCTSPFIGSVRPAKQIERLAVFDPSAVEAYGEMDEPGVTDEAYYAYTPEVVELYKPKHLAACLIIADGAPGDSSVYLLNPEAVTEDGEWEAWHMAHWIPGVERYPSFAHLMLEEYHSFRNTEFDDRTVPRVKGPFPGASAPDRPRGRARSVGKPERESAASLDELVDQLESDVAAERDRAADALFRQRRQPPPDGATVEAEIAALRELEPDGDPYIEHLVRTMRREAERPHRTDLINRFARILAEGAEPKVRSAAAAMLGTHGDERALPLLLKASREDRETLSAVLTSMGYLSRYHRCEAAVEPLLSLLDEPLRADTRLKVLRLLAAWGDTDVVPVIVGQVSEEIFKGSDLYGAVLAAAKFGAEAVPALTTKLNDPNPRIRAAAAAGLGGTGSAEARVPLEARLNDPDDDVRLKVRIALDKIRD